MAVLPGLLLSASGVKVHVACLAIGKETCQCSDVRLKPCSDVAYRLGILD